MKAFHGDPAIKEKYIARVRRHREADELVRGKGWDGHKGCAVGCTLEAYNHAAYETELGIPEFIAGLEDQIFEGLPLADAMQWPEQFLDAIPVGADLSAVWRHFLIWLLGDPEHGTIRLCDDAGKLATQTVIELHRRHLAGDPPATSEWAAARAAARDAARAAAWAAARAADWDAARDAARAAAWAADWDAARDAARAAAYQRQRDKLLELLRSAEKSEGGG